MSQITGAEVVRWNLKDLYTDTQALLLALTVVTEKAKVFAETYRGRIAGLDDRGLADMMAALAELHDEVGKAYTYAYLDWSTQTTDPNRGALLQTVREEYTKVSQYLIFVEVEWSAIDTQTAHKLLASPYLMRYRHYLELQQIQKRHLLSEPEEKILSEKSNTGVGAWNRFFDETLGAAVFSLRGQDVTEQEVLTKLSDSDRDLRREAALSLTEGLEKHARILTFIFNTILADKASSDRLRGYASWISSRNAANEIEDDTVEALVQAVTGRYDLVSRFYKLKKHLLGLDEMMDYDRYAPIGEAETQYTWQEAERIVREAYSRFHPELGRIVGLFFDQQWIDAPVAPGKRGGAYSHGAVPSVHPYIFMNFTGRVRDVQTLAHELGHGVHQYLSREQGVFHADTPLTTAETASVFGEMLVFQELIQNEENPKNRLALLMSKLDDSFATVFRQIAMNRFEAQIHTARREKGEQTTEAFSSMWRETQQAMFGDSVTLGDHYKIWWSYIPHFLHTPGYVYAYAFGELLVLSLYKAYQQQGQGFSEDYLSLLRAGGSDWPHVLVGKLGVDLTNPAFWQEGLQAIEEMLEQAELLAASY
ncbi:MAG: M3 family oligoendopeptidase [Bacteroidetes Order II. Incertae sedis bacterium]|nr:M3 family oligoendopeptidase [Bacteroidetes Order II. bacterium]